MLYLCTLVLVALEHVAKSEHIKPLLSEWIRDGNNLPYGVGRAFVVYHETTDTIFGIGGTSCTNCSFSYNLTNNIITNSTTNATKYSNDFVNGNSCNSALINNNTMFALDRNGNIWQYNVETNDISIKFCLFIYTSLLYDILCRCDKNK